ncbi:hypothetical protein RS130_00550 [Paraglaciecola aquimarina]|uniref:Uncharacterized protein n=1 Tax=Paraglaciecola aquimarina TaxID=1235557 RepID=A0ABU3SRG7_9ALTE|nr:hypothetical protein [Paraglaciecola aquimarina]MDU0352600.1 hypothetical protein [Paraglaciecola aquimarina]
MDTIEPTVFPKEEAKGIFLYADYVTDDWLIDGTASKSSSINEFHMSGLDLRHSNKTNKQYTDLDTNQRLYYAATGINGEINTGNGDLSNAFATLNGYDTWNYSDVNGVLNQLDPETGEPLYDLGENAWQRDPNGWKTVRLTSFGSTLDPKINPLVESDFPAGYFPAAPEVLTAEQEAALTPDQIAERSAQLEAREAALARFGGKSLDYYVNGRVQRPERDFESGEVNFERYTELGNDAFTLTSVKFGGRHSREILETFDLRVGGAR